MSPMLVIEHAPYTPNHIGDPALLFSQTIQRLNAIGVDYCVGGGTLMGLVRDKKLIPTDTDLDFMILVKGNEEEKIRAEFSDWQLAVECRDGRDERVSQLAYYPDNKIVDFHFYYKGVGGYNCHHQSGSIHFSFDSIEEIETRYGLVKVPNNPKEYLRTKYGEDWQVPQYQKKGNYDKWGMVFGCFDPFHYGHLEMIAKCYEYCQNLTIIVRTDNHIRTYKHREPFMGEVERARLASLLCERVELSADKEAEQWIGKLTPAFFFVEEGLGGEYSPPDWCKIIEIPTTPHISSSKIRGLPLLKGLRPEPSTSRL